MTINIFNSDIILGFFDADGSFEAKVFLGVWKPVSFHVNIIFYQKDISVIQMIIDFLDFPTGTSIPKRTHSLESENEATSHSKSIGFSTPVGQQLLCFWEQTPPRAPSYEVLGL
jgi:hypothetical protein